ncbi:MAG: hypothetical protein RUMPE_00487 [Eubacteriales bacterium SKADARSKE-1]|nr:hypothetical protein [Eubacteriales bacterium SKADARSKE-1]
MLKKCISLVLSLIMLSGIGSMGASALSWPWGENEKVDICDQRNEAGGYLDLDCAKANGVLTIRSDPYDIWQKEKVGKEAEYTLQLWPYNILSNFVSFFNELLFNARTEQEIALARQKAIQEVMFSFGLRREMAEEVVKGIVDNLKLGKLSKEKYLKDVTDKVREDTSSISSWGVVGVLIAGGIAAVVSLACPPAAATVGLSVAAKSALSASAAVVGGVAGSAFSASSKASDQAKISQTKKIEVSNYISAIEQILACIKNDCWKDRNTMYIRFCSNPEKYYSFVSFLKLDMKDGDNYMEYSKSFTNLGNQLPDILKEYK